jgi:hypothetical protein
VPQDINPDSYTKSALIGGESPMVIKHPAPNTKDVTQESWMPLSPGGAKNSLVLVVLRLHLPELLRVPIL